MSNFDIVKETPLSNSLEDNFNITKIKVVGIGDGGVNAINNMIEADLQGIEFITIHTDVQALHRSKATNKIQIGTKLTKGLGAGGNVEIGKNAAIESESEIRSALNGAHMIFLTSGFGGGTGTGATPVIAKICQETEALTIAVISKPFGFALDRQKKKTDAGLQNLAEAVDNMLITNTDTVIKKADEDISFEDIFKMINEALKQSVKGVTDLITKTGNINIDFNDIKTVLQIAGSTFIGTGIGTGENKAKDAVEKAMSNYMFEDSSIGAANGLLLNITIPPDIKYKEVEEAIDIITNKMDKNAEVKWGYILDENLKDEMIITIIITGINSSQQTNITKIKPSEKKNRQLEKESKSLEKKPQKKINVYTYEDIEEKKKIINSSSGIDSLLSQTEDSGF